MAVLADSRLTKIWWAEAATTVAYLSNLVPHTGEKVTPYEAMFGNKPDVSHLRVFVFRVLMHLPVKLRRKLEPRAVAGVFLGYGVGQKSWRVLMNGKVEVSRAMRFLEGESGVTEAGEEFLAGPAMTSATPLAARDRSPAHHSISAPD